MTIQSLTKSKKSVLNQTITTVMTSKAYVEQTLFSHHFIARTGIFSKIPHSHESVFFGGFSCKSDPIQAKEICYFEVLERLLATYYFSNPLYRDSQYPLLSLEGKKQGSIVAEQVILGPTQKKSKNATNAIGLSFHTEREQAVKHAICEEIERSFLGQIWYEEHPTILLEKEELENGKLLISHYTVKKTPLLPFVMSIMEGLEQPLFCLGASFSENFKISKQKATAEAIMLANDILCQKSLERIQNFSSQKRMQSQIDPTLSKQRSEYLKKITSGKFKNIQVENTPFIDLLRILKLKSDDVNLCYLHSENDVGFVVRAVIRNFNGLSQYRQKYMNTQKALLDPVC